MKKTLLAAAALAVIGAPVLASAQTKMVFALVPKNMNNPFFDQARDGCKKAEKESNGKIECYYIGPGEHGGGDEQVQVVQDLITKKVNGIAVSPSNAPAMAKVLERAKAANIPVTTWDSDLLPADKGLRKTYIGTHNYDIGVNLAKIVMNLKPKGGTICIQSGGPAAANHNERMQGIRDTISGKKSKEPPGDRLTGQNGWTEVEGCPLYTNDDFPLSVKQMGEILAKYPNLTAFVPTGGFPQFVPNAYKQVVEKNMDRIKSGKTILVVADTLPVQMDLMKAGYSSGQVGQRPFDMGYKSMFILQDIVNGKQVGDPIYTGLDVCTPATAATCIAK
jgi:ribose transport system substrate-binding protein